MITAMYNPSIPWLGVLVPFCLSYFLILLMPGIKSIVISTILIVTLSYFIHLSFVDDYHDYYIAVATNIFLFTGLITGIFIKLFSLYVRNLRKIPLIYFLIFVAGFLAPDAALWIWTQLNWP